VAANTSFPASLSIDVAPRIPRVVIGPPKTKKSEPNGSLFG
jgi:hypothetical protein